MDYQNRVQNIQKVLDVNNVDAILISSAHYINYLTGYSNFSHEEREAFLLITPTKQYIITDGRYTTAIKKSMPFFDLMEISYQNKIQNIITQLSKQHQIQVLGIEENSLTVEELKTHLKFINKTKHVSLEHPRSIKDDTEIKLIKKSCEIGDQAFNYILDKIKIGVTEKELAFELEFFIRKQGANISFDPIVAFGENSAVPHHHTGAVKLQNNQFVLLDFGARYQNYCSDMTRTIFFGKPTNEHKKMYQTVFIAQEKAAEYIQEAVSHQSLAIIASDIDKIAREYIISQGYPDLPHSLGHGIGLQVHERPYISPKSTDTLKPGMVFSIEPGIYIPQFGGVRIEDLYFIDKDILMKLTQATTKLL